MKSLITTSDLSYNNLWSKWKCFLQKKERQLFKWSIFTMFTRFFAVISLTKLAHVKIQATSCHFTMERFHKFQLSRNPVTLQGHSNWHNNVECNIVYHYTKVWKKMVHKCQILNIIFIKSTNRVLSLKCQSHKQNLDWAWSSQQVMAEYHISLKWTRHLQEMSAESSVFS